MLCGANGLWREKTPGGGVKGGGTRQLLWKRGTRKVRLVKESRRDFVFLPFFRTSRDLLRQVSKLGNQLRFLSKYSTLSTVPSLV